MAAMRTMGLAPVFPPNARVDESKGEYVVRLPVPGFAREEIELEIADRVVSLCGVCWTRPYISELDAW